MLKHAGPLPQGGRVRLRPTRPDDLDWVLAAEGHPENRPFVTRYTRALHEECLTHPDLAHLVIESLADGGMVGYVILAGLAAPQEAVELRRIVVTEKGRGYGRETLRLIAGLTLEVLGTRRLWLDVRANNPRARRLYEEEGYKAESTTPDGLTILSITRERGRSGESRDPGRRE
jgi:RimJ/RimL family protein N-acetyltransferase